MSTSIVSFVRINKKTTYEERACQRSNVHSPLYRVVDLRKDVNLASNEKDHCVHSNLSENNVLTYILSISNGGM